MNNFLNLHGYSVVELIGEDGSTRRFYRAKKSGSTAIFMDCSAKLQTPGHKISDFIRIGAWLSDIGLKAPEIYEIDEKAGFALIEDFGGVSFKEAMEQGQDPAEIYQLAGDILDHFAAHNCPLDLPGYAGGYIDVLHRRVIDWYVPALRRVPNPDGLAESYLAAWQSVENSLPPYKQGFIHADFHVENLMWLPGEDGIKRCGIIDFQGAMVGHPAYDLGNLLEDMRADVPGDIRQRLLANKDDDYLRWYRVLTTQFHCRLMGQIIRWAVKEDKPDYLQYLPRIAAYLEYALEDPVLAPVKQFFSEEKVDLNHVKDLNVRGIVKHIRCDAV